MVTQLTIKQPDDWHVHFRDGIYLHQTVNATASLFRRALVMPNLVPALTTIESLLDYEQRIYAALSHPSAFSAFMTFYLNESVTPDDLIKAASIPSIVGAKLYPSGATTNSSAGTKSLPAIYPLLDIMQAHGLVLQIHGEVTHSDIFERESLFLSECLTPIIHNFPKLKIVLEHISTKAAVDFVFNAPSTVAATITPHHLMYNRNHMLVGGIKPHYYCLPILKHQTDQKALLAAATSANAKFFAGTDSAPHSHLQKEAACGCAGIYSAPHALSFYTQVFDELNQLDKLNEFASVFGALFYEQPLNQEEITLIRTPQKIPQTLPFGDAVVIPMGAGESVSWSLYESN